MYTGETNIDDQNTEELPQVLDVEVVEMDDDHYKHMYPFKEMGYNPAEFRKTKKKLDTVVIIALIAAFFGLIMLVLTFVHIILLIWS